MEVLLLKEIMTKITKRQKNNSGFTLVEMMVSVAIFSVIMTVGIGALVSVLKKYEVAQEQKAAADSLNFVLESITRELRLGSQYHLFNSGEEVTGPLAARDGSVEVSSSQTQNLIGFNATDNRGYMIFSLNNGVLYRTRFAKDPAGTYLPGVVAPMTDSTQVIIKKMRVTVMNAQSTEDLKQPLVWMQIVAAPPENTDREYVVQSLVSQRLLDA